MAAYQWKIGMPVDAQVAGEELERIRGGGSLTPEKIVDESRDENAVLHKCFEWNDSIAGELYRREQARYIIRNITCVLEVTPAFEDKQPREVKVRAYENVSEERKALYKPIQTIMNNPEQRQIVLRRALTEALQFKNKYESYTELAGVCKAINDFATSFDV